MSRTTRRRFLEESMIATAAAVAAGSSVPRRRRPRSTKRASANDTIRHAVIGCRIRGARARRRVRPAGGRRGRLRLRSRPRARRRAWPPRSRRAGPPAQGGPGPARDLRRQVGGRRLRSPRRTTGTRWPRSGPCRPARTSTSRSRSATTSAKAGASCRWREKTGRICQGGTQNRSNGALAAAVEYIRAGQARRREARPEHRLRRPRLHRRPGHVRGARAGRLQPLSRAGADGPAHAARSSTTTGTGSGTPATASWGTTTSTTSTSAAGAWA